MRGPRRRPGEAKGGTRGAEEERFPFGAAKEPGGEGEQEAQRPPRRGTSRGSILAHLEAAPSPLPEPLRAAFLEFALEHAMRASFAVVASPLFDFSSARLS